MSAKGLEEWATHMKNLGYAGSSADPLNRGIEGCMPGSMDAKARVRPVSDLEKDRAELKELNDLIAKWREPGLLKVRARDVIPDFGNRGHTGLSVEHVHYIASSFRDKGFIRRRGNKGHDIPVLVRESPQSEGGKRAIENLRGILEHEDSFAPKDHYERVFTHDEFFCSLGNGHWNQALNLFLYERVDIWKGKPYIIGGDEALREAIEAGVDSIVLKGEAPVKDRLTVSRLLNSKREYKWQVDDQGRVDITDAEEDTSTCKQFEALSKVLDAQELNCLVRLELGVKDGDRVGQ